MLSREKLVEFLINACEDTNSEKDRFIKDILIQIEFGAFEPEEEDDSNYEYENFL